MKELRKDELQMGPLRIIKLPTMTNNIKLSECTPNTIARMGFHKTGNSAQVMADWNPTQAEEFEFQDVNEEYLEARRVNE